MFQKEHSAKWKDLTRNKKIVRNSKKEYEEMMEILCWVVTEEVTGNRFYINFEGKAQKTQQW